ncbi:hypothetical protein N7490_005654 [Penicillium lividum]|nr:hypothetical protein N7490_005654 [Penicillium lividum]
MCLGIVLGFDIHWEASTRLGLDLVLQLHVNPRFDLVLWFQVKLRIDTGLWLDIALGLNRDFCVGDDRPRVCIDLRLSVGLILVLRYGTNEEFIVQVLLIEILNLWICRCILTTAIVATYLLLTVLVNECLPIPIMATIDAVLFLLQAINTDSRVHQVDIAGDAATKTKKVRNGG